MWNMYASVYLRMCVCVRVCVCVYVCMCIRYICTLVSMGTREAFAHQEFWVRFNRFTNHLSFKQWMAIKLVK